MNIGDDSLTSAAYSAAAHVGADIFCPSVGARQFEDSTLVIMNTGNTATSDVAISFWDRHGDEVTTETKTGIQIPAHAHKSYNLRDDFNLPQEATGADFLGSARITSESGASLAVVAFSHWGTADGPLGTLAYNCHGPALAAYTLYAPKVQRRKPLWAAPPGAVEAPWFDLTGLAVVNTENKVGEITVAFFSREGNQEASFTDPVPIKGYASRNYNTRYYGSSDPTVIAEIDKLVGNGDDTNPDWQGSAVIQSDVKIVGVVKQLYPVDKWASGYNMLTAADARQIWFFPLVYRRGFNLPWTDYSGLICQNVSDREVALAPTVSFVNRNPDANPLESEFIDPDPFIPNVSHGYNTRYGGNALPLQPQKGNRNWFGDPSGGGPGTGENLADNFLGSAVVSVADASDTEKKLICIQENWTEEVFDGTTWRTGGDSFFFNVVGLNP